VALHLRMPLGLLAAESEVIVDSKGDAAAFQTQLASIGSNMPLIDRTPERKSLQGQLFSTLIDLRKDRAPEVAQSIVLTNYQAYIRAITLLHGAWQHRSRHFVKNPELAGSDRIAKLHVAIGKLMGGDINAMIVFTEDLIEELGGPVWSGRQISQEILPETLPVIRMLSSLQAS
jgi:hypothetical protein